MMAKSGCPVLQLAPTLRAVAYTQSATVYIERSSGVYTEQGHTILEVATYCDEAEGKVSVWDIPSFLVPLPATLVDMPVAEVPIHWALWNLLTSCLQCL